MNKPDTIKRTDLRETAAQYVAKAEGFIFDDLASDSPSESKDALIDEVRTSLTEENIGAYVDESLIAEYYASDWQPDVDFNLYKEASGIEDPEHALSASIVEGLSAYAAEQAADKVERFFAKMQEQDQ